MRNIHRTVIVPHTIQEMFELVNDVEAYPLFLPWCSAGRVLKQVEHEREAQLEITWAGFHKTFTTRNHLHPHEKIEMKLVNGPFHHLEGKWHFQSLNEKKCQVTLDLEFELMGNIFDKAFSLIFMQIANSLVEAFCKRAEDVYGSR